MSNLKTLLDQLRDESKTEVQKGEMFEDLVLKFLRYDKTYSPQFSKVHRYADWARGRGKAGTDIGIDLVAENADDASFTAIQCKFYRPAAPIGKGAIDSFIAASDKRYFSRRLFVDTTTKGLGKNVEESLAESKTEFTRLSFDDLYNSSIDWGKFIKDPTKVVNKEKKTLRADQLEALKGVRTGLQDADRGKLIMACGTGKTFISLKIAEERVNKGKRVLFLAPSLSIIAQSVTEWSNESDVPLHIFAVCSDTQIGKRRVGDSDSAEISSYDLAYPPTTNAAILAEKIAQNSQDKMTVVFATYQSIEVIATAQQQHSLAEFDLIICDEAHRTAGVTLARGEEGSFVKVHNQAHIKGKKRIYMTATPRVYTDVVKAKADEYRATLYSMDDEDKFGQELYTLKFGAAVEEGLLSDYKVLVFVLDEGQVAKDIKERLATSEDLKLTDATKILGCYKALGKVDIEASEGRQPMNRALAFCRSIKSSRLFTDEFEHIVQEYQTNNKTHHLRCEARHVDGTMNTAIRGEHLNWLKERSNGKAKGTHTCRILSNAKCLSEGVDVPSLDAVLFIHARKSIVDIVQSVGRVMRKAKGKKRGYVILPIMLPAGTDTNQELDRHEDYKVIWQVLNALRSHDERLNAEINQIEFGIKPERIEVVNMGAIPNGNGEGSEGQTSEDENVYQAIQPQLTGLDLDSVQQAILVKIVQKCGTRYYWEDWAGDIARIAARHSARIKAIISDRKSKEYKLFSNFVTELKRNLNQAITDDEVVETLAQHIITKPVFDALFEDYDFTSHNPVSQSMQALVAKLSEHRVEKESESLAAFYASVKRRVAGIQNAAGKQKIIIELYEKFFGKAFPKLSQRLGIVFTPVECVDFIIHSINDLLKQEFGKTLGNKHIHIVDPFAGTGTFITRLLQSGLISKRQLAHKYTQELHANEIILLAYYIAAINIEVVYRARMELAGHHPFDGICLTDTFQLYEDDDDLLTPTLKTNNERRQRQRKLDIKIIMGNPPYSVGQRSGSDDNLKIEYPKLDTRIKNTYASLSTTNLKRALYDSYVRAIRWASDRIGAAGIIGFITNAGWLESNAGEGLRASVYKEFSSIYVFHLRGGIRGKSGDRAKKEGQNVFDIMTPVAISILVKNPQAKQQGKIYFYDIGDYLDRQAKLGKISELKTIEGITQQNKWRLIKPDKYQDWFYQRDDSFYRHIPLGDKKDKKQISLFDNYSLGLATNRDAWIYNSSKTKLAKNVKRIIAFYNSELARYNNAAPHKSGGDRYISNFVNKDKTKIAWTTKIRHKLAQNHPSSFIDEHITQVLYRPFIKQWGYYERFWNERVYQLPQIFPAAGLANRVIGVSSKTGDSFSALMSDQLPDLHTLESGYQCFPLFLYRPAEEDDEQPSIYDAQTGKLVTASGGKRYYKSHAINDAGLKHFSNFYKDDGITKEDIFYYIYGLLHSEDYRKRFGSNLRRDLPRITRVKTRQDFIAFTKTGRRLADLHLNYEKAQPHPVEFQQGQLAIDLMTDDDFYVTKMKFASKTDKSTILYNPNITLTGIPLEAYEYVVGGKPAIEWVMKHQGIRTHADSQITNNANDWAAETMDEPKYPLLLLQKVITVSLETVKIIKKLPPLDI